MTTTFFDLVAIIDSNSHQASFNKHICDNIDPILACLGGINNVLKICLTHPHIVNTDGNSSNSNKFDTMQLSSLEKILTFAATTNTTNKPSSSKLAKASRKTITSISSSHNCTGAFITTDTTAEYYSTSIIFNADFSNNLYFKFFDNKETAQWMTNFILTSKWYFFTIAIVSTIFLIGPFISSFFFNEATLWLLLMRSIFGILSILGVCGFGLTLNMGIMELVVYTFDFWFKVWNLLVCQICFGWINIAVSTNEDSNTNFSAAVLKVIVLSTYCIVAYLLFFLLDAMPLPGQRKRIAIIILVVITVLFSIMHWFTLSNLYYDVSIFEKYDGIIEFDADSRVVSIKNIYLSAYTNMTLFIAKPLLIDMSKWFDQRFRRIWTKYTNRSRSTQKRDDHVTDPNMTTVHKYPKVKWYKPSPDTQMLAVNVAKGDDNVITDITIVS